MADKKEITVTYTVEVTEVFKGNLDEEFLRVDYPDIIKDRLRNKMEYDDVHINHYKVFVKG